MGSDRSLALINSSTPTADGPYEYVQSYPIRLPGEAPDWRMIDFSGMVSIASPTKALPILKKAKRFEMTDAARQNFGYKLAAFFVH